MTLLTPLWLGLLGWPALQDAPAGQDWPAFLGPAGDNSITASGLARAWPAEGPPVLWRTEVGLGFAGAALRADEVYLLDRIQGEADVLRCLGLADGSELWSHGYEAPAGSAIPVPATCPP